MKAMKVTTKSKKANPVGSKFFDAPIQSLERSDFEFLFLSVIIVPLTWFIAFGWRTTLSIAGHDAIPSLFTSLEDLKAHSGDWTQFLYRLDLVGGVKVHDIVGVFPIHQLAAWMGLTSVMSLNLSIFLIQICYCFLAMRATLDLSTIWKSEPLTSPISLRSHRPLSLMSQLGLIWIFAFLPVSAWRLAFGHFSLFAGNFAFVSVLSLILAALAERMTLTLMIVSVVALVHCYPSSGQQSVVYSLVFGTPLLLGILSLKKPLLWTKEERAGLWVTVAVMLASLGIVFPRFMSMVFNALGSDTSRNLKTSAVTYSYVTAQLGDWISSIPWANEWIPSGREVIFHHEINYAFGPFLLLLALVPWRKAKGLGVGVVSSLILVLIFSMDLQPFSTLLIQGIPLLKSFRVPERAIFSFSLLLPIMGCAALLYRFGANDKRGGGELLSLESFLSVGAAFLIFFLPIDIREVVLWGFAMIGIGLFLRRGAIPKWVPLSALFLILGTASLSAFQERLLPFVPAQTLLESLRTLGSDLIQKQPDLASPLTRVRVNFQNTTFVVNTGYAMGLSTLDGYWLPTGRFLSLKSALEGIEVNPTVIFLNIAEQSVAYPVLRKLYNLKYLVESGEQNTFSLRPAGETAGPAWFSYSIQAVKGPSELVKKLNEAGEALVTQLHHLLWVDQEDLKVQEAGLSSLMGVELKECSLSKVLSVDAKRGGQSILLHVQNQGACPLTLSMNYTENLRAYEISDDEKPPFQKKQRLTVFPSYGALASIMIPANVKKVVVEAYVVAPGWSYFGIFLGLVMLAFAGGFVFRIKAQNQGKQSP